MLNNDFQVTAMVKRCSAFECRYVANGGSRNSVVGVDIVLPAGWSGVRIPIVPSTFVISITSRPHQERPIQWVLGAIFRVKAAGG